jgi:histidinol dehydrogenase
MANELDKILIKYDQPDIKEKMEQLFRTKLEVTWFPDKSKRDKIGDIVQNVKQHGVEAIAKYTKDFDDVTLTPEQFRISDTELNDAHKAIDKELLKSIQRAIKNVQEYQEKIFIGRDKNFGSTGIKYIPLERVGICIPGASAPLPSTVIMTAVPAQVAGVKEIVAVSPPRYNDSIHPVILATCKELNIKEVYKIGGVQAVAALAFGIVGKAKVDKIVGPGNAWVQMAKREVFGVVDIDSIAGPSEVLIIADKSANPAWVAADMLSQAEHSPGSALLFTDSEDLAKNVLNELHSQIKQLGREQETAKCLMESGAVVILKDMTRVIKEANAFAPEHLEIQCGERSKEIAAKIENAGAIFIGEYSPVATGDYWAGPSHTLPTGVTPRFFSALTSNDFVKSISIIEYDKKKLAASADDIIRLAEAEGLDAHARSVRIRQGK